LSPDPLATGIGITVNGSGVKLVETGASPIGNSSSALFYLGQT